MLKRWLYIGLAGLWVGGADLWAALEWEKTEQELNLHPLQKSVTVEFLFLNRGREAVSILELKPNCSCISGSVEPGEITPGGSGIVSVTFDLNGRKGKQKKGIGVISSEDPEHSQWLYVSADIPETYVLDKRLITWESGEHQTVKRCRLKNLFPEALPLSHVETGQAGLVPELRTLRDGFEYELTLRPTGPFRKKLIPVTIYPQPPKGVGAVRSFVVYCTFK